jgi:uncharacterized protein
VLVDCDFRKWGGKAHWRFHAEMLGRDEHGTWLGSRPPTAYTGPQGAGEWEHSFVVLVPHDGWWVAAFNAPPHDIEVYVDMTTPPEWVARDHVTMVDLDLDVIRSRTSGTFLDDEDEFTLHQQLFGYPEDVVDAARACSESMMSRVTARDEPFGETALEWLTK